MSPRLQASLIACVALVLSALAYSDYIFLLGFPDGFISALGRAQLLLAWIFIGVSAAVAVVSGWLATRPDESGVRRPVVARTVAYAFAIAAAIVANIALRANLPGSGGG